MELPHAMRQTHAAWERNHEATYWPDILAERQGEESGDGDA
jgi:hypothetical protein